MSHQDDAKTGIESLCGHEIVIDVSSPFVFLGTLDRVAPTFLILVEADAHDLRETSTTREAYVLDAARHGISANRKQVWVRRDEIVCVSRITDLIT